MAAASTRSRKDRRDAIYRRSKAVKGVFSKNDMDGFWSIMSCVGLCTPLVARTTYLREMCPLSRMYSYFDPHCPNQGHSPPERPRLRKQLFVKTLKQAASLTIVSSRGKTNPRTVKRRNSPYASHDRQIQVNYKQKFQPSLF